MMEWLGQPVCIPWYPCYSRGAFVVPGAILASVVAIRLALAIWGKDPR